MKSFTLKIITPEKTILEALVGQVTLPIVKGEVTLLADHMPFIGSLNDGGEILVKAEDQPDQYIAIAGGFVEFHNNTLTVLADSAERAEDIDILEAENARKRAEKLQKQSDDMGTEEYESLMRMIQRQTYRVKVAKKHHSRYGQRMNP